ncbi:MULTISPECIES: SOS response-associated peptidase [unclassified Cupriavidus]|jgi:putative SOS response-associated peptidase YedK|uniref:SOS response-associated peptidase n=1 Tax=unclassified Cupriavidus TaxID=2640874 RepID=UPI0010F53FC1|nr:MULTISPECIES: SOS response-associated peptidase family protein [unclassified Cupriavidus]QWE97975.1 SOS response-associated peptidase [Cupriavidus sp. EM10]
MCVNYAPVQRQILRDIFGVEPPPGEWRSEAWPDYPAPIIRRANDSDAWESVLASFSMVPKKAIPSGTRYFPTANARVETIGQLRSFASHWRACQFALIPATAFFEPNWETGKAVRWKISVPGGEPFAIAGLWRKWPDGAVSFTMPTLNADSHPLLRRFHKPGSEKRAVVVLPKGDWDEWLHCRDPEVARTLLRLMPSDLLVAQPAPIPPKSAIAPPSGRETDNSKTGT